MLILPKCPTEPLVLLPHSWTVKYLAHSRNEIHQTDHDNETLCNTHTHGEGSAWLPLVHILLGHWAQSTSPPWAWTWQCGCVCLCASRQRWGMAGMDWTIMRQRIITTIMSRLSLSPRKYLCRTLLPFIGRLVLHCHFPSYSSKFNFTVVGTCHS